MSLLTSTEATTTEDFDPVSLEIMWSRLISIADDCLQHVGQAAYVRGLLHD